MHLQGFVFYCVLAVSSSDDRSPEVVVLCPSRHCRTVLLNNVSRTIDALFFNFIFIFNLLLIRHNDVKVALSGYTILFAIEININIGPKSCYAHFCISL